jgi:hypothetical protein
MIPLLPRSWNEFYVTDHNIAHHNCYVCSLSQKAENWVPTWTRVLDKLVCSLMAKKSPSLYGTLLHSEGPASCQSWPKWIQSTLRPYLVSRLPSVSRLEPAMRILSRMSLVCVITLSTPTLLTRLTSSRAQAVRTIACWWLRHFSSGSGDKYGNMKQELILDHM